eukprot:6295090-Prymnesium_polylepis.1
MGDSKVTASVWKQETKFYMANERTLIAWLRIASTIGVGALVASMASLSGKSTASTGTGWSGAQIAASALIVVYAFAMYHRRCAQVRARHMGTFDEVFGPAAVALIIVAALAFDLQYLIRQPSVGCLALPLPVWHNATPPYLYVSFHGTSHIRHGCQSGIGGIHRFEMASGHYAGPATDQMAAEMLQPRGMLKQNGMLFVAESWIGDSSVVVYGPCAGTSPRAYLGRIRPDAANALAFGHPYGLASGGDNALRLSTQDGGAVIAIDVASNNMYVDQQVEPLPNVRKDSKSGPLRGIAIDSRGCQHVADKRANQIVHHCPGVDAPTATNLAKPISLYFEPK